MRSKVLSGAGARLVIGGPGGIGKTSVALAIFHSPELDGAIPPTRRFFVPCQSVTTASTFLSAIASSLGVKITARRRDGIGDGEAKVRERTIDATYWTMGNHFGLTMKYSRTLARSFDIFAAYALSHCFSPFVVPNNRT